jgi:hypothetical protein
VTPVDFGAKGSKIGQEGRDKGAVSYSAAEHFFLLIVMIGIRDSCNSAESFPEWKMVYQKRVEGYYTKVGAPARQTTTVQSHFVELYSCLRMASGAYHYL